MSELLPLIPFDMGGWIALLPPSHPFVRDREDAKVAQKLYEAFDASLAEDASSLTEADAKSLIGHPAQR